MDIAQSGRAMDDSVIKQLFGYYYKCGYVKRQGSCHKFGIASPMSKARGVRLRPFPVEIFVFGNDFIMNSVFAHVFGKIHL